MTMLLGNKHSMETHISNYSRGTTSSTITRQDSGSVPIRKQNLKRKSVNISDIPMFNLTSDEDLNAHQIPEEPLIDVSNGKLHKTIIPLFKIRVISIKYLIISILYQFF